MLPYVALYACTLLVYLPGLIFIANRQRILQFPVTAFTFLGLFVFNAAGSIFVMLPELPQRDDFFSLNYLYALNLQAVLFYLVAFPYVAVSRPAPTGFTCDRPVDGAFLKVLLMFAAGIVGLYVVNVGLPPLLVILKGGRSLHEIVALRTQAVYGRGDFWLYNLGFTTIPLIAAIHVLAIRSADPGALRGARWIVAACILVNALPGGKGAVLDFCTALLVAYFLIAGWNDRMPLVPRVAARPRMRFSYGRTALYLAAAFVPVLAMYRLYLGPVIGMGKMLLELAYRIVGVYSESMAAAVRYVELKGTLNGIQLPTVHGLFTHERLQIEPEMHHFMFGAPGAVPISGPMEGYINFGWSGFLVFCVATFASMIFIEQVLRSAPRNVFTVSILAFYCVLATKASQVSLFATFVSLTYVVVIGALAVVRQSVASWMELGQAVPERR